jgi:hypothetical protein
LFHLVWQRSCPERRTNHGDLLEQKRNRPATSTMNITTEKVMTIRTLVLKPIDLLIHAAKKQLAATVEVPLQREWLDDHEFSFDAVGRSINGLPIRRASLEDRD